MRLDIAQELAAMERMTAGELQEKYSEVCGEQARSRNRRWLIRRIAWRLQANAEGDLSERARRRAEELANDADARVTPPKSVVIPLKNDRATDVHDADPRLPAPGTAIIRKYKGRTLEVRVLVDGFEYDGQKFKTLSAVAKEITGSHCNGFRFFKLGGHS